MKRKVTIKDVAKYAGVSVATVSNVINNINKASDETREMVLKSIKETGYQPDFAARCLANGKSNLIGVMLPITEKGDEPYLLLKDNPFFSEFLSGIDFISRKRGYDFLIAGIESGQKCKEWIVKRNLDGIIILGFLPRSFFDEIEELNLPVVLIDAYEEFATRFHRIMAEDNKGGYIATKHLISLGHRNIAFATGSIKQSPVNRERFEGYKKALQEAGIVLDPNLIFENHVTYEGGYQIGKNIIESNLKITAVTAVADIVAFGLINVFRDHGKVVPDDYSIVGFDDIRLCEYVAPRLTTIRQNIFKKGIAAVEAIIGDIELPSGPSETKILSVELVQRESTQKLDS
jgi:Transcriptional regulators